MHRKSYAQDISENIETVMEYSLRIPFHNTMDKFNMTLSLHVLNRILKTQYILLCEFRAVYSGEFERHLKVCVTNTKVM